MDEEGGETINTNLIINFKWMSFVSLSKSLFFHSRKPFAEKIATQSTSVCVSAIQQSTFRIAAVEEIHRRA